MNLMTKAIYARLPKLYNTEHLKPEDKICIVKFFCPWNQWTWYAVEGQHEAGDFMFFGRVDGQESEWGYFTLSELESITGRFGLKIERDLHFGYNKLPAAP